MRRKLNKSFVYFTAAGVQVKAMAAGGNFTTDWMDLKDFNGPVVAYLSRSAATGNPKATIEITDSEQLSAVPWDERTVDLKFPAAVTRSTFEAVKMRIVYTAGGATGTVSLKLQRIEEN